MKIQRWEYMHDFELGKHSLLWNGKKGLYESKTRNGDEIYRAIFGVRLHTAKKRRYAYFIPD